MTTVRVFLMKSYNTKIIALKQNGDSNKKITVTKTTLLAFLKQMDKIHTDLFLLLININLKKPGS